MASVVRGVRIVGHEILTVFAGLVAAPFEKRCAVFIPHRFVLVDHFRGAFPGTAGSDNRFPKSELATTGRAALGVESVEFFKVDDEGLPLFFNLRHFKLLLYVGQCANQATLKL